MKHKEKVEFLQDNHFDTWLTEYQKAENLVSDSQSMFCCCGRLATGLHESRCRKFIDKVQKQTAKALIYLIPKSSRNKAEKD